MNIFNIFWSPSGHLETRSPSDKRSEQTNHNGSGVCVSHYNFANILPSGVFDPHGSTGASHSFPPPGQNLNNAVARQDTWERPQDMAPEVKISVIARRPKQTKLHLWWEVTVSRTTCTAEVSEEEARVREEGFVRETSLTLSQMLLLLGIFLYSVIGKGTTWPV